MFTHSAQCSSTAPNYHEFGVIFDEVSNVIGESFDCFRFARPFNLFLCPLHVSRTRRRPCFAIHSNLPLSLLVNLLIEIHYLSDCNHQIPLKECKEDFCGRIWSCSKTARMHLYTCRNTNQWSFIPTEGMNNVPCGSIPSSIENRIYFG